MNDSSQAPRRWPVVALLMGFCFISHINRLAITVAANHGIMQEFRLDEVQMGLVFSSFLFVYTLFMIPGGLFIDRVGPRTAMAVMGFGSAFFGMLTGSIGWGFVIAGQALITFMLVRGLMGLVTTPLHPGAATAVGTWIGPERRNLVNGLITGAALLGVAFNYRIVGKLIEQTHWSTSLILLGFVTALISVAWWQLSRSMPAPAKNRTSTSSWLSDWRLLVQNRSLLFLTLSYAAMGYFQYVFFYWMEYYFEEVLKLGAARSQYLAGIPPLTMAIFMPLGGLASDWAERRWKYGRISVPIGSFLLGGLFLLIGISARDTFWIVFWFSLALGVLGGAEAAFWSTAVQLGGARGGSAAALMNTGGNAGGMLAPILTPLLSRHFGWGVGIGAASLLCLMGAFCWVRIRKE